MAKIKIAFAPKSPTSPRRRKDAKKHKGVIMIEQLSISEVVKIAEEYGKIWLSKQLKNINTRVKEQYFNTKI